MVNSPGTTPTRALLAGSAAINAGDNAGCPVTDQRGVARPQGAACDIGAYELVESAAGVAAPALSQWGQIATAGLLLGGGLLALRRRTSRMF